MKTLLLSLTFIIALPGTASAQIIVQGGGLAKDCYTKTKLGNQGSTGAIRLCTDALDSALTKRDRAATLINRGVLQMRGGHYDKAIADYDAALTLKPKIAEAHINKGAALLYQKKDNEALTAINTGISLGTDKMPEALYNRSLIFHRQKNYKAAYLDLKKSLELRPGWAPALTAMERYDVKPKKAGS